MHLRRAPITDRKLRFALVGCGRIAANHIDALRQHGENAEIVALCDTDPAAMVKWDRSPPNSANFLIMSFAQKWINIWTGMWKSKIKKVRCI